MPYKCVHCLKLYDDGAQEVLGGCSNCGRRFFFYIKKEKLLEMLEKKEEPIIELAPEEKEQVEKDVREIAGIVDPEEPIFLDFESVKVIQEGKYLLDLSKLFSGKPQVYQLEDGKYIIDLASSMKSEKERV